MKTELIYNFLKNSCPNCNHKKSVFNVWDNYLYCQEYLVSCPTCYKRFIIYIFLNPDKSNGCKIIDNDN